MRRWKISKCSCLKCTVYPSSAVRRAAQDLVLFLNLFKNGLFSLLGDEDDISYISFAKICVGSFRFLVYIYRCQYHKEGDEEIHLTVMTSGMEVAPTNKLLIGMKLTTSTNIAVL